MGPDNAPEARPRWVPLVALLVGLLLVPLGLVAGFLGAYMTNGEAGASLRNGGPMLAFGLVCTLAGLASVVWGSWKLFRRANRVPQGHLGDEADAPRVDGKPRSE